MARKREPKTIEEARTLILAAVPEGTTVTMSGFWYDNYEAGRTYASQRYSCEVDNERHLKFDVTAVKPAELVKKVLQAIAKAEAPTGVIVVDPAVRPTRRDTRAPATKQSRGAAPRLTQPSLLLPYSG